MGMRTHAQPPPLVCPPLFSRSQSALVPVPSSLGNTPNAWNTCWSSLAEMRPSPSKSNVLKVSRMSVSAPPCPPSPPIAVIIAVREWSQRLLFLRYRVVDSIPCRPAPSTSVFPHLAVPFASLLPARARVRLFPLRAAPSPPPSKPRTPQLQLQQREKKSRQPYLQTPQSRRCPSCRGHTVG